MIQPSLPHLTTRLIDHRDGVEKDFALVPLEEGYRPKRQKNLAQRIWNSLKPKLDIETPDRLTTDSGVSVNAGSLTTSAALAYYDQMKQQQTRKARMDDYDRMDEECVEASAALDIVVGNVFLPMEGDRETHDIIADDNTVREILVNLDKRIETHEIMPEICRSMLKDGDSFEEVVADETPSIIRLKYLNPRFMIRCEDRFGRLESPVAFKMQDESLQTVAEFKPWQVVHTRFRHQRGNLYGKSFFYNSRKPWRQLAMMEDGVVIKRLTKATKRYAFYIPVPKNAHPDEKKRIVAEAIAKLKRRSIVDSDGKLDLRRSPLADDEDFYIPVEEGGDQQAKVEVFDPGTSSDNMLDVTYFRDKMILPTRVPKAYMGLEADTRGRAMLGWQDVEFGRMIRSVQKIMAGKQRRIYDTELLFNGYIPTEELYSVIYPPISFVDEQMRMAIEQVKWTIVQNANTALGVPLRWLLENIIKLSEKEVEEIVSSLEPKQVAAPGMGGGGIGQKEMGAIKESVFTNMRLQNDLFDLRNKLRVIIQEKLHQPLVVTETER